VIKPPSRFELYRKEDIDWHSQGWSRWDSWFNEST
jgi:hypothetical protein